MPKYLPVRLEDLGYNAELEAYRKQRELLSFDVGRVVSEHRERYRVRTGQGEYDAEVIGNLRYSATNRSGFPAVGDWVAVREYDENKVLIHEIFPRKSMIERTAAGRVGEKQIIATNIDYSLILQSVDRDFSLNRIERYLTICYNSGIKPVIILTKTDLITDGELKIMMDRVRSRTKNLPVIPLSNETRKGYDVLSKHILKGKTYCLLGSSGVGKSTLINNLAGENRMKTGPVSSSTKKGKHITSHRELIVLANKGILIDNPGMREVGIADAAGGLQDTYEEIIALAEKCRYKNCTHIHEDGCAVIEAVESGKIEKAVYDNYQKMLREKSHFESTVAERRKKEKDFGKFIKNYKKNIRRNGED